MPPTEIIHIDRDIYVTIGTIADDWGTTTTQIVRWLLEDAAASPGGLEEVGTLPGRVCQDLTSRVRIPLQLRAQIEAARTVRETTVNRLVHAVLSEAVTRLNGADRPRLVVWPGGEVTA